MCDERITHPLAPVVDPKSRVLILGTMPSVASLERKQYYGHKRNQFWPMIFTLMDNPLEEEYDRRIAFALQQGIAIWDVVASCVRPGSLDSHIRDVVPNDFSGFFERWPGLRRVFFNGASALQLFKRHVGLSVLKNLPFTLLPSTSPAYTLPFEQKLQTWVQVKKELEKEL